MEILNEEKEGINETEDIALLRCSRNTGCSQNMLVAIMVAGVWNILSEEGHSNIHASLSQCSNSTWDYWNTNCFVCFSSEGLLAHLGSHFVWTDRLGSLMFFSSQSVSLATYCAMAKTIKFGLLMENWSSSWTLQSKQTMVPILWDFNSVQFSALYALRVFSFSSFLSDRLLCYCGFSWCRCVLIHDS